MVSVVILLHLRETNNHMNIGCELIEGGNAYLPWYYSARAGMFGDPVFDPSSTRLLTYRLGRCTRMKMVF